MRTELSPKAKATEKVSPPSSATDTSIGFSTQLKFKIPEVVNADSNKPANIQLKCDMCDSRFKEKITLEKHKDTKHSQHNCSLNKKI